MGAGTVCEVIDALIGVLAPKGPNIPAQGKRSVALGCRDSAFIALKGVTGCDALSGLVFHLPSDPRALPWTLLTFLKSGCFDCLRPHRGQSAGRRARAMLHACAHRPGTMSQDPIDPERVRAASATLSGSIG